MIRFLIDQFRKAPGPLKKPRILVADLAEEIVDLAEHFLKKGDTAVSYTDCCTNAPSSASPATPMATQVTTSDTVPASDSISIGDLSTDASNSDSVPADLDPRLVAAISIPGNIRKQEFKVLAILWDAHSRKIGALSAKSISKHGEEVLKVQIRHENVRKVIRMRLENYVKVHAQGVGNGTVYNYELADAGVDYFMATYFK